MKLRIANQLSMVGACLNVANSPDFKPVWTDHDPSDLGADLAKLQADYAEISVKAALAEAATGGAADAKSQAETALEEAAFVVARALANHFKKIGDLDRLGKVDVSLTGLVRLRTQALVSKTTAIRDLGLVAVKEQGAAGRGVTIARVETLTAAINTFREVMSGPRGQIVNRSTLLREVETDTAALMGLLSDIDDLIEQFDADKAGLRFQEAWKQARIIVDTGGGHIPPPAEPTTPPAPVIPKAA